MTVGVPAAPSGASSAAPRAAPSGAPSAIAPLAVLRASALRFGYPQRDLFRDWSADFGPGLTWLRGANGSGKSTLLKLLAGALPAQGGVLVARDRSIVAEPIAYRREVAWCGPGELPFAHLSPREFFGFMRGLYPRFDAVQLQRHVEGFRLDAVQDTPLERLSTGAQRKAWLAAVLAAGSAATLLDEPANALDAGSMAHLREHLLQCAGDPARCWVVASHDPLIPAGRWAGRVDLEPS